MSEETIDPFTVRDALILHDKKIENINNLFHETQSLVQSFKVIVESLDNRINNGLSPTLQKVKDQNVEIEKSMIRLENSIGILAGKVTGFENDRDNIKKMATGVITKVAAAAVIAVAGTFFTMWTMMNRINERLGETITAQYMKIPIEKLHKSAKE